MRRFIVPLFLALFAGVIGLLAASSSAPATASTQSSVLSLQSSNCVLTPISFSLSGTGPVGATRPFTMTQDDMFAHFVAPPITATASTTASLTVNDSFNGTVSGGITGTFAIPNLNGLVVFNPGGFVTTPRGMQLNDIVITGASGTITAVMAIDFVGIFPNNAYPRTFNAYLHSTSTTGAYAPYRFVGAITLGSMTLVGGNLTLNGTVIGTLYVGADTINQSLLAIREAPADRAVTFQPTDVIAQFRRSDLIVGTTAPGRVQPLSSFTGTTTISNTGGFVLYHNGLLVDGGPNSGRGWLAGGFNFADGNGDLIIGPWVSDLTTGVGTSVSGYVFKAVGTGVYTDSIFFASVNGTILNRTAFGGTMTGVFCAGSELPTPTPTLTPIATATGTATTAPSVTPIPTNTAAPTTSTPQPTLTFTPPPATPTIATPPPTSTPMPTATSCPLTFSDVPPENPFHDSIRCLACRGIVSGYDDGTFKPGNEVTRGQLSKIVSNAAGFTENPNPQIFEDVPPSNPFYEWINRLARRGYMGGYECGGPGEPCVSGMPYFRPFASATRGQTSKIVANAAEIHDPVSGQTFEDVPPDHPFYLWIEQLAGRGVMGGYECGGPGEPCQPGNRAYFRSHNNVTRGQSAKIVANTFYPNCQTPIRN